MPIRVLIADDHPIVRSGVKNAFRDAENIEVAGEATNADDALRMCRSLKPDVLILDIHMPGIKAVQLLHSLRGEELPTRALILTAYSDPENVSGMLKAGATGYLVKDEEPETILEAVSTVAAGHSWISPLAMKALLEDLPDDDAAGEDALSERELDVLRLLAQGLDNASIAAVLTIAEGTVKNHITSIYEKIGAHSRAEAVAWAWKHGMRDQ